MPDLHQQLVEQLGEIEQQGQLRHLVPVTHLDHGRIDINGRQYLNLAGNDYLGLATNHGLLAAFFTEQNKDNLLECYGLGSTASRLMTGSVPGCAIQIGHTFVFGRISSGLFAESQNILVRVVSSAWTSRPITGSYSILDVILSWTTHQDRPQFSVVSFFTVHPASSGQDPAII